MPTGTAEGVEGTVAGPAAASAAAMRHRELSRVRPTVGSAGSRPAGPRTAAGPAIPSPASGDELLVGRGSPAGIRTRSLQELFAPGGPRLMRSPSVSDVPADLLAVDEGTVAVQRVGEPKPLGSPGHPGVHRPRRCRGGSGNDSPGSEPRSISLADWSTMKEVPSSGPPVTTRVGWVGVGSPALQAGVAQSSWKHWVSPGIQAWPRALSNLATGSAARARDAYR